MQGFKQDFLLEGGKLARMLNDSGTTNLLYRFICIVIEGPKLAPVDFDNTPDTFKRQKCIVFYCTHAWHAHTQHTHTHTHKHTHTHNTYA